MVLYKNSKRPKLLTLNERLIKNKQYLKRRLLRISKRANWLKRKLSKRLKYIIKPRRKNAYYNAPFIKKQGPQKQTKIKKTKRTLSKTKIKYISIQNKPQYKTNEFCIAKVANYFLRNKRSKTFTYFN